MPFYVAPEQQMKDRADFARKGIARGRSVVVLRYADGISSIGGDAKAALEAQAPKRVAIRFKPVRTATWDHRKLGGIY